MNDQRSPARPWFNLVKEQAAIKGWSMHELSRRSGVGRPTIYRWRDGTEIPQARPVGLVADALGIPRERAVRLAGIVTVPAEAERSPPVPPELADKPDVVEAIQRRFPDPRVQARMLEAMARALRGEPQPPTEPGAGVPSRGEREAG